MKSNFSETAKIKLIHQQAIIHLQLSSQLFLEIITFSNFCLRIT